MFKTREKSRSARSLTALTIASLCLVLSSCVISPGKFKSDLALGPDKSFSFSYEGEILVAGLSSDDEANEEFKAQSCYDADTFEKRECTAQEIAEQRSEWDASAEFRAAEAKQQSEQVASMLGGIDPSDPDATEQFRQLLIQQKGWNSVIDKGEGVFEVSYSLSGTLTHNFAFPMIEGVSFHAPFVEVVLREDNLVSVNAPALSTSEQNPMGSLMLAMSGMLTALGDPAQAAGGNSQELEDLNIPTAEGVLTVSTTKDMTIQTNNSAEGPSTTQSGQRLVWQINDETTTPPSALIQIAP